VPFAKNVQDGDRPAPCRLTSLRHAGHQQAMHMSYYQALCSLLNESGPRRYLREAVWDGSCGAFCGSATQTG
jgi:hypothetical protein